MEATEWLLVLAGQLAQRAARKQRRRETRKQMADARAVGLMRRHAEKQQRMESK